MKPKPVLPVNPLNGSLYSKSYFEIYEEKRKHLLMIQPHIKTELFSLLTQHQGVIISVGTSSGKSVETIPQVLEFLDYKGCVLCVQPKRVPAFSIAQYVAKCQDVVFGEEVGYAHGGGSLWKPGVTKILFATEGTVVQMMLQDPLMRPFSAIAMDEVHERTADTDILLYLLQQLTISGKRPDMPVLMLSATIDPKAFAKYFKACRGGMGVLEVAGAITHPVERIFLQEDVPIEQLYIKGAEMVVHLLNTIREPDGDIVYFLPGGAQMSAVSKALESQRSSIRDTFEICILTSSSTQEDKVKAQQTLAKKLGVIRKVVLATEVAEASVTFDNMLHVIDCGVKITVYFEGSSGAMVMDTVPIAQSNIIQRMGRVGRTRPGYAHMLYTKDNFESRPRFKVPSIKTDDPTPKVLEWLAKGVAGSKSLKELHKRMLSKFMDPFDAAWTGIARKSLIEFKFLNRDTTLTALGRRLAPFGLSPGMCLAMDHAEKLGCVDIMLLITTVQNARCRMNIPEKLARDMKKIDSAAHSCELWQRCLMLQLYLQHTRVRHDGGRDDPKEPFSVVPPSIAAQWCNKHALDADAMESLGEFYDKQLEALIRIARTRSFIARVDHRKHSSVLARATQALVKSLPKNVATLNPDGSGTFLDGAGTRLKCKDQLIKSNEGVSKVVYLVLEKSFDKLVMGLPVPLI